MLLSPKEKNDYQLFIEAFFKFAGCSEKEIEVTYQNGYAIVLHKGTTYKVATYQSMVQDLEDIFEARDYNRIASEIQGTVWIEVIENIVPFSISDFIVSLYQEWNLYWKAEADVIKDEKAYNTLRTESWEQLIILIETVKTDHLFAAIYGLKLDERFLPIIALAIRQQYEYLDHFCDDLIEIMTKSGLDNLSFGDTYEVVTIGSEKGEPYEEQFYIYNPPVSYFREVEEKRISGI